MGNVKKKQIDTKLLSIIPNLRTNCHVENINLKVDHHTGGKWFIHGHYYRKENQSQSLEPPADYPKFIRSI